MRTRMTGLGLMVAALLVSLLQACSMTESPSPEDILSEDDLDTPAAAPVDPETAAPETAVSDTAIPDTVASETDAPDNTASALAEEPLQAPVAPEAEPILKAVDEDVVDYAIADYKSFDPSGIVVHFEFDDARLSEKTIAALNKIVAGMKKDPLARVSVRGHADKQGTESYNKSLSARRAKAIEDYLIQHGIEKDRLNPIPMGESDPVEEGNTIAVFKKNRRGDFTINYGPSAFGKAP